MSRDEYFELFREIRLTGVMLSRERDADLKEMGMTSAQNETLLYLETHPGIQISELRDYLRTSHQATRTMVERMAAKGLLEIAQSETDRRARILSLSEAGIGKCAEIRRKGGDTAMHALNSLTPEERAELRRILDKISRNLSGRSAAERFVLSHIH